MTMENAELIKALEKSEGRYRAAICRLQKLASTETEDEIYELTVLLREAVDVGRSLRRFVAGRSVREIHQAFGAPGDFGYETPIGEALSRLYNSPVTP